MVTRTWSRPTSLFFPGSARPTIRPMETHLPTGPVPPPPRFGLDTDVDPSCEHDIDLADEDDSEAVLEAAALARATDPEGVEFLGEYPTLEAYFRALLEPEIAKGVYWLLDCLDYRAVQDQFESGGGRLMIEHGHVYLVGGR